MRHQKGFTLIETVVFIVVVSVALAGIASLFRTNIQNSVTPLIRERALALAQAYMDEILAKRWDENTPVGGGCINTGASPDTCTNYCASIPTETQCNRSKCTYNSGTSTCEPPASVSAAMGTDGVSELNNRPLWNDLDDFTATPAQAQDINGTALPDYSGFSVNVAITKPAAAWNGVPADDVRRITVSVTSPMDETITLIAYRVNF